MLLDSSTLQEIGLRGMRFLVGIWTPKEVLKLEIVW
jgi:hypothetical protein